MLFNSIEFVLFYPLVTFIYWVFFNRKSVNSRNFFLLTVSYVFYGWWDYRFLALIFISSIADFLLGLFIFSAKTSSRKRQLLFLSLFFNLGVLFFFKYYGFFSHELAELFHQLGYNISLSGLNIILPVGISFYTFQTLSYTIDIYRGKLEPTKDIIAFMTFICFFPQLVAGPIERAKNLLPQFYSLKKFDYERAANGFRQLLWGFFAKIAVADSIAPITDSIFSRHELLDAGTLIIGAVLFSVQIFGDFAGYSNIAIGTASILGFDLMQNFNNPYFSRNIREFWTRWHISLSSWFRDYVYFPLGGNRCSPLRNKFNIMTTFIVSGLWHGANWTFLIWGSIHGIFYLITKSISSEIKTDKYVFKQWLSIVFTFFLVTFAFVFFRADNLSQALSFLGRIIRLEDGLNLLKLFEIKQLVSVLLFSVVLFIVEWYQKDKKHGLDIAEYKLPVRHAVYYAVLFMILFSFQTDRIFIYFQF